MPRKSLQINLHPTLPFRSSNLAIPPSPFTPRAPLTPPATLTRFDSAHSSKTHQRSSRAPAPPPTPLKWVWQCHLCHRQYRIGVTRRCLDDGHFFCSGVTTTVRRDGKRVKKHRACGSEFDYSGWKKWNTWRRDVLTDAASHAAEADVEMTEIDDDDGEDIFTPSVVSPLFGSMAAQQQSRNVWFRSKAPSKTPKPSKNAVPNKNCWNKCDYPSECRWSNTYGVQALAANDTQVTSVKLSSQSVEATETPRTGPATDFKDILTPEQMGVADAIDGVGADAHTDTGATATPPSTAFEELASLVQTAQRRKSRTEIMGPSPLASNPVSVSIASSFSSLSPGRIILQANNFSEVDLGDEGAKSGLSKTLEDYQLDLRRGLVSAKGLLSSVVWAVKGQIVEEKTTKDGSKYATQFSGRDKGKKAEVRH